MKLRRTTTLKEEKTEFNNIQVLTEQEAKYADISKLEKLGYTKLANSRTYPEAIFLHQVISYLKKTTNNKRLKVELEDFHEKTPWTIVEYTHKFQLFGTKIAEATFNETNLETKIQTNNKQVISAINELAPNYMKALEATYHKTPVPVSVIMKQP